MACVEDLVSFGWEEEEAFFTARMALEGGDEAALVSPEAVRAVPPPFPRMSERMRAASSSLIELL